MKYLLSALVLIAVLAPVAAFSDDTTLCTDRPTKSNLPCTAPTGEFQYETDAFDFISNHGDTTTLYTNPTFKYGLNDKTDVELSMSPLESVHNKLTGETLDGVGDLYARLKYNVLTTTKYDDLTVTLLPYVKLPTAEPGIGNKSVEGGLIVPASVQLPQGFQIVADPEIDTLKDLNDDSRHTNLQGLVNVSHLIPGTQATGYAELWTEANYDPAGTVYESSADFAVSYPLQPNLQLDLGTNVGLNNATPALQIYTGVSQKF